MAHDSGRERDPVSMDEKIEIMLAFLKFMEDEPNLREVLLIVMRKRYS